MMNRTTLILSSSVASPADIKYNGAEFQTQLPEPIRFPKGTTQVQLRLLSASIWNSVPNLPNTQFNLSTIATGPIVALIPKGQYSVSLLDAALNRALTNGGYDENAITLVADEATQKIGIQFTAIGGTITFNVQNAALATVLGFNVPYTSPATTFVNEIVIAPNVAQFNSVNQFQIHSTLVEQGIPYANQYTRLIGQVPISASPGSLINYEPTNAPVCSANSLLGNTLQRVTSVLTNEKNELVDTNGESWTYTIELRWF
jgi:hypothetical protein